MMLALFEIAKRFMPGLIAAALVLAGVLLAYHSGFSSAKATATLQMAEQSARHSQEIEKQRADAAQQYAAQESKYRERENKATADMAQQAKKYHMEISHDKTQIDIRDAAISSGQLRLRERFTCGRETTTTSTGDVPKAATPSTGCDGASRRGLQQEDAIGIIRLTDEADRVTRQLAACQAIVLMDRGEQVNDTDVLR